ncbi:MAG: hypothetical protein AAGC96_19075, partial [Pseudomonadota bacterium]
TVPAPDTASDETTGEQQSAEGGEQAQRPANRAQRAERRGGGRGGQWVARLLERYDVNGDGKITRAEYDEIRTKLFSDADTDGNTSVSLEEFATVWQDMNKERIVRGFQRYDTNGDLSITRDEYTAGNVDFIERNDRNGDGVVTKADRRKGNPHGKRSERRKMHQDRAKAKDLRPVQPILPDQKKS